MPDEIPQKISDEQARQVLELAARIDAADRLGVSVHDLRSAAVEAGISTSALEQALRQITRQPAVAEAAPRKDVKVRRRWVYAAAAVTAIIVLLGIARAMVPAGNTYVEYLPPPPVIEVPAPPPAPPPPPPPPPG